MKKNKLWLTFVFGLTTGIQPFLGATTLEDAWTEYKKGDYSEAQKILSKILEQKEGKDKIYDMSETVGAQALMEMSQNRYLQTNMRKIKTISSVFENKKFRNPRRLNFYIRSYIEDDSTRHKSLPNLLLAGSFAVPGLLAHLHSDETNIVNRGLAYQAIQDMGQDAIPALIEATNSNDEILLINLVHLFNNAEDQRAVPFLLRLQKNQTSKVLLTEISSTLKKLNVHPKLDVTRAYVNEALRYLSITDQVQMETFDSDGVLWTWNTDLEKVVYVNALRNEFEYYPEIPNSLWPLFKAEFLLKQISDEKGLSNESLNYIHSASMCVWIALENKITDILGSDNLAKENFESELTAYLAERKRMENLLHWYGMGVTLTAIDMSESQNLPLISSKLLQMLKRYENGAVLNQEILSFHKKMAIKPVAIGLNSKNRLIKYWSAIASVKTNSPLIEAQGTQVITTLQHAASEVDPKTVLIVSKKNQDVEALETQLLDMGYYIENVESATEALLALNRFPKKDMVIINGDLNTSMLPETLITRMKQDSGSIALPVVILSNEEEMDQHMVRYQDYASSFIFNNESIPLLKEKFSLVRKSIPTKENWAESINLASLDALNDAPVSFLLANKVIAPQIAELLAGKLNTTSAEILAMKVLRKYKQAGKAGIPILMEKLDSADISENYRNEVLKTLFTISKSNPHVREVIYEMMTNKETTPVYNKAAAAYLAGESDLIPNAEKNALHQAFFSTNLEYDQ